MKKYLVLAGLLAMSSAHADWLPAATTARTYTLTINYGGGSSIPITENKATGGPLSSVAAEFVQVPDLLENGLNTYIANMANSNGAHFASGNLNGSINIALRPQAGGFAKMDLNGFSYSSLTTYSGSKFGILNYSCQNSLYLNSIAVTAQYGAVNGVMGNDVGLTFDPHSYTDCDSNLGWIVPGVSYLVNSVATRFDVGVETALRNSAAKAKDALFFKKDQNLLSGLDKLVPENTVINGYPLGKYVRNNLTNLMANSQVDMKIDRGALVGPVRGIDYPGDVVANVVTLAVTTPGTAFTLQLTERASVRWNWICNYTAPSQSCVQP